MPKVVTLGNGQMLVGLDGLGRVRDLYYPYVGLENHVSGASGSYAHRIGVWVDNELSWLDDGSWAIEVSSLSSTAVGIVHATNSRLGIELTINDVLYNERSIFLRRVSIHNTGDRDRTARVFFSQQFRIAEDSRGATGFFDPRVHAIIHYKHQYNFLINAVREDGTPFDDYTVGLFDIEGKDGSHHDAEDGVLTKNPIEHGSVDSVLGVTCEVSAHDRTNINYWVIAGDCIEEVHEHNAYILKESPERIYKSTTDYWQAWLGKADCDLSFFPEELQDIFFESLLIVRAHTDDRGAIIASSDSDMLQGGRDTYSYMWPRDASISAYALDEAGYNYITRSFYSFCEKALTPDGYFMHKYCADGSLGSSWHPWVQDGEMRLPIQIDETALVLYSLGKHYKSAQDLEYIESIYNSFIEPASKFLCSYIEPSTGLPKDSFDLWEEKYGSSTYSAAAVYGALNASAMFADMLGKRSDARKYTDVAKKVQKAILKELYDDELGMFVKLLRHSEGGNSIDPTVDMSSFHGVVFFDVLPVDDPRVQRSYETVRARLQVPTDIGGFVRYEGDEYYKRGPDVPSNPWFITTLWVAQYDIRKATTSKELEETKEWLHWVANHAHKTGVLSEQLDPLSGEHISTAPLTWSHAEYVLTMLAYNKRAADLLADTIVISKSSRKKVTA